MIPQPIQNTEFINDFWLSIIDNLTLVVLAVFGYWTSRRLEAIKSREEARKAMIDQRIAAVLDQWYLVRYFHFDVVDAWGESDPEVRKDEARRLVERYEPLRRSIRDHRRLLGQTIAEAMYASIAEDLPVARALASEAVLELHENPDFEWLEQLLGTPDTDKLTFATDEKTLEASRESFLSQRRDALEGSPPASPPDRR